MKKRYLFPIIYIALLLLMLITKSDGLLMLLIIPQSFIFLGIEVFLDTRLNYFLPFDSIYLAFLIGIVQFFILGYIWERIADWFDKKPYWD